MYVVSTLLILPGGIDQAFHLPLYSNGANNFAPKRGHTIHSMSTGTNQKDKYALDSFHSDQTRTD